jgi:hypothetical protein
MNKWSDEHGISCMFHFPDAEGFLQASLTPNQLTDYAKPESRKLQANHSNCVQSKGNSTFQTHTPTLSFDTSHPITNTFFQTQQTSARTHSLPTNTTQQPRTHPTTKTKAHPSQTAWSQNTASPATHPHQKPVLGAHHHTAQPAPQIEERRAGRRKTEQSHKTPSHPPPRIPPNSQKLPQKDTPDANHPHNNPNPTPTTRMQILPNRKKIKIKITLHLWRREKKNQPNPRRGTLQERAAEGRGEG